MTIEKIIKELNRLEEKKKMQEMKEAKMIEEAVLILNPKQAKIKNLGIKYVIFSEFCEEDKIYMVTDKTLAQAIRKYQDNFRNPDIKNTKLEKAKEIIKKNFRYGDCGLFKSRNVFGDPMHNIYNADGLKIDICFCCGYFEVFGLTDEEFKELEEYYIKLEFESEEKNEATK